MPSQPTLDDALRKAYGVVMRAAHDGAYVSLHVASEVYDALRERWPKWADLSTATTWGVPLVVEEKGTVPPTYVAVRAVIVIS